MTKHGLWIWMLAPPLVLVFCCICTLATFMPETKEAKWYCPPLPETFRESDLIGVWQAQYFPRRVTDTLILREDGTYRQIYEDTMINYYYSGPWNRWYIEYRPSGGIYLHMQGMRYCVGFDETCRRPEGGGGDHPYYDPCERRSIRDMGSEVLLAVTGPLPGIPWTESPPRGILLWHMKYAPEDTIDVFVLQEAWDGQGARRSRRSLPLSPR